MEQRKCIKCGSPIVDTKATGRPAVYCGTACRRAAEHEVRRINSLLEKLEQQASYARLGYAAPSPAHIKRLAAEIELQETRLRELLSHDG